MLLLFSVCYGDRMLNIKISSHTIYLPVASTISKRRKPTIQVVVVGQPDTVFFAGFGNEGATLKRIAMQLEAKGITDFAVVSPLPYWHIPATETDIKDLGITGAVEAAAYIRKHYAAPILHAVGESQTAGALAHAANIHPEVFNGKVGLLRPLGFTTLTRKEFKSGLRKGMLHPTQMFDWRSWPVGATAAWRILQDYLRHGGEQFNLGITWDNRRELKNLLAQKPGRVRIFAAEHDRLFSAHSIRASLSSSNIASDILEVIPGIHASPATRVGSLQVAHAIRWCKSNLA